MNMPQAVAVNHLPSELLVEIAAYFVPSKSWEDEGRIGLRQLFGLAQVCSYWRETIVDAPRLWTTLPCQELAKTQLMLERARGAPLSVTFKVPDNVNSELDRTVNNQVLARIRLAEIAMVLPSISQIQRLTLYLSSIELQAVFLIGAARLAPVLKKLEIGCADDGGGTAISDIPANFLEDGAPVLQAMVLHFCRFDTSWPALARLKVLNIHASWSLSAQDLMRMLSNMLDLEHLETDAAMNGTEFDFGAIPVTTVPNLEVLRMFESDKDLHAVLEHLCCPRMRFLWPCGRLYWSGSSIRRILTSPLAQSLHFGRSLVDQVNTHTRVRIEEGVDGRSFELHLDFDGQDSCGPELELDLDAGPSHEEDMQSLRRRYLSVVSDYLRTLRPYRLTLGICGIASEDWVELFAELPIHELYIYDGHSSESLVEALGTRIPRGGPGLQQQPTFTFSSLKALRLFGIDFDYAEEEETTKQTLKRHLVMRAAEGLFLDSLDVSSCDGIGEEEADDLRESCCVWDVDWEPE